MSRIGFGLLLLIAVLAALAVTILLTAPKVGARQGDPQLRVMPLHPSQWRSRLGLDEYPAPTAGPNNSYRCSQ